MHGAGVYLVEELRIFDPSYLYYSKDETSLSFEYFEFEFDVTCLHSILLFKSVSFFPICLTLFCGYSQG